MKRYYLILVVISLLIFINIIYAFFTDGQDDYSIIFKSKPHMSAEEIIAKSPAYEHNYDVLNYKLVQNIDMSNRVINAETFITVKSSVNGLNIINFDFFGMTIDGVYREGKSLTYSVDTQNGYITVNLDRPFNTGENFTVQVNYHGRPTAGLTFSGSYAFTVTEPNDAHCWFPCYDDPSDKADTSEMQITVPDNYYVASNGKLMDVFQDPINKTKTYHWFESHPIATYLISIACYPYIIVDGQYHGMPCLGYVDQGMKDRATVSLQHQDDMLECYYERFGIEFPFIDEKYANAGVPLSGGMENETCTAMGNVFFNGNNSYDWIFAHESAHSWWGDSITCRTWKDIWLNEGFATYCDALFAEWFSGWDAFYRRMQSFKQAYFNEDAKHRYAIYDPEDMWNATVYEKGGWVLHMLRHVIGDDKFFSMMNDYGETYKYKTAITSEFETKAEDHYRSDLSWFFDEWIYKAGYPEYEWEWWQDSVSSKSAGKIHIHVVQVQKTDDKTPLFKMPIDFKLVKENGDETVVLWNDQKDQEFVIDYSEKVSDIQFDPYGWLLCKMSAGVGIELTRFELNEVDNGIRLGWSVIGDDGGYFNLYKRTLSGSSIKDVEWHKTGMNTYEIWDRVNKDPITGKGDYSYTDKEVKMGTKYEYKLEYVESNVAENLGNGSIDYKGTPESFYVSYAYPNPFSDEVNFDIGVNISGRVVAKVFDISGRQVGEIYNNILSPRKYTLTWDGNLASGDYIKNGQYFISFNFGERCIIKKVVFEGN